MELLTELLPAIISALVAIGVAVARTTDNKIDDKVARLAEKHESKLTGAVKRLVSDDKAKK
jgi:hypothetical protein